MAPARGVCSFNPEIAKDFAWAEPDPKDAHSARCKLCAKTFSIATMGRSAFVSHAAGKKHKDRVLAVSTTPSAAAVLQAANTALSDVRAGRSVTTTESDPGPAAAPSSRQSQSQSLINKYMLHDAVTKSEIVWCLQAATRIHSNRAAADCVSLFPLMFPDSEIAKKMQLHRDKIGYIVTYGVAPFLRKQLFDTFAVCDYVTIGFDEALNEVNTKKQMDLVVRFWDPVSDLVSTRYLTSVFLQSATATDLRLGIKNAIGEDLERKLLQISMDGPTVNFKMLKDYQQELKEDYGGNSMVDLGSCGLHVVHGAFKTGVNAVQWDLKEFLIGLHYLFYKSPARRGHFTKITSSEVFPIPFCFTRWIENDKAGSRAIAMLPHLKTWVDEVRREGKNNILNKGHKNFDRVARALKDRLLGPKLAFFVSSAQMIEPFFTAFQSNNPMAPLLYRELESLTVALMERVVLKNVLQKETKKPIEAKDFDLGFATKAAIREANNSRHQKIPDGDLLQFRKDCMG
ncbi:Purine nucleoside phosphorylase DeoD-type [Frankliniella fusca]|uniref:Purine nucleoside phosphorylase DeoD-type n=1 Tax=Frankliniella fusca TaxID=407009 RepID=A0AAE1LC18_9NEOP|nr:Purine nucleoside phosphorylase DeoD-type [Frankliniella fusca]